MALLENHISLQNFLYLFYMFLTVFFTCFLPSPPPGTGPNQALCTLSFVSVFSALLVSSAALTAVTTSFPSSTSILSPKAVSFLLLSKSEYALMLTSEVHGPAQALPVSSTPHLVLAHL